MNKYPDVTESKLDGSGLFDEIMRAIDAHLLEEYSKQRVKGADYAKVYLGSMEAALVNSVQYLTATAMVDEQKEQIKAQTDKIRAEILLAQLEKDRLQAEIDRIKTDNARLKLEGDRLKIEMDKIKLEMEVIPLEKEKIKKDTALVEAQIRRADYELLHILPLEKAKVEIANKLASTQEKKVNAEIPLVNAQVGQVNAQTSLTNAQKSQVDAQTRKIAKEEQLMTAQINKVDADIGLVNEQLATAKYNRERIMPEQYQKIIRENELINSKIFEVQAQVTDSYKGFRIGGLMRRQMDIYEAQKDGFKRDAEQKAAKIMVDAWSVLRTTDEGFHAYSQLGESSANAVIQRMKSGIGA